MTFKREIEPYLIKWKARGDRKPLIIRGARQVGKTTLVEQFAKTYKYSILLNLEKAEDLYYFQAYDNVKVILEALFLTNNISMGAMDEAILFIDEIQESPKAIHFLRFFYEEFPNLHVIAAGSLLEFALKDVKSFPVGRVEFLYLYPLNFSEYLSAINHDRGIEALQKIPIKKVSHHTLLNLFNRYAIIGGMPEVIKTYILNNEITDLPRVYESIWGTYQNDVEKYASNQTIKKIIKHIISTAHFYLDQRIKFQNFGNSNYRSREVGEAMRSLDGAKIIQLIYPTTDVSIPIRTDLKKSPRLQFLDSGIINYALGIQSKMLAFKDLNTAYKGAIIPHLITQEIISLNRISDKKPHFWVREKKQSSSEVDLVYSYADKVIPIEIKSGSAGTLKSLHQFIERTNHPYAIRMYARDFNIEKNRTPNGIPYLLMNLPYYLGTKLPEYIEYFVENFE